jgi:hypothetical protein
MAFTKGIRVTVINATDHKISFGSTSYREWRNQISDGRRHVLDPDERKGTDSGSEPNLYMWLYQCGSRTTVLVNNPTIGYPTARLASDGESDSTGYSEGESHVLEQPGVRVRITRRDDTYQKQFDVEVLRCEDD